MKNKTALIILNYNGIEFLPSCLASFLKLEGCFDIYFLDNGSTDGSVDYVKKNYPRIKVTANLKNLGIGKALNALLKKIINKYKQIGIFNTDIIIDRLWLKESIQLLSSDPDIFISASYTQTPDRLNVDSLGGDIINLVAGIFGGFQGGVVTSSLPSQYLKHPFKVFFGLITGMLVKTEAFYSCGYFDESYFMYFEDIDFSWRVLLAGKKVYCNPSAKIIHFGHGSVKTLSSQIFINQKLETNLLSTYYKNLSPISLLLLLPLVTTIRIVISLCFILRSPSIAIARMHGILIFYKRLITGQLNGPRSQSQSIRVNNDFDVLTKNNPSPIFRLHPDKRYLSKYVSIFSKKNGGLEFDGERMINHELSELYQISIERYNFAKNFIRTSDSVLDIACGSGIGTSLLSFCSKRILGVDKDPKTINYCNKKYKNSNTAFVCDDALKFLISTKKKFDCVTSFETIEHLTHRKKFLLLIKSRLKKQGLIILSTPNNYRNINPPENKYHKYEYSIIELHNLLRSIFTDFKISVFGQNPSSQPHGAKYQRPSLEKVIIKKMSKQIYEFDQRHLNLLSRFEHTKFYKLVGSWQKDSKFDPKVYQIDINRDFVEPSISLFLIKTGENK